MKLHHFYYSGQVFNLDQKTMNEMIEDVEKLRASLAVAVDALEKIAAKGQASPGDTKPEMAREALEKLK